MSSVDHNVLDVGTEASVTDGPGETNQPIALPGTNRRATRDHRCKIILGPLLPPSVALVQQPNRSWRDLSFSMGMIS